jgi:hypothetical protein
MENSYIVKVSAELYQLTVEHGENNKINLNRLFNLHVAYSDNEINYIDMFKCIVHLSDTDMGEVYNDGTDFIFEIF